MTDSPQPHIQTRDTFITLYNTRLFTAEQVWDMSHRGQCVERDRVLIELLKKSHIATNTEYFEGKLVVGVSDIVELLGKKG